MKYVLLSVFLFTLILLMSFKTAYYSSPRRKEDPRHIPGSEQYQLLAPGILALVDQVEACPFEWVYISSKDGLKLAGRYYHIHDGAPLAIIFHGYRSTSMRDCAPLFILCRELGYNVLLPDMRAHGHSQGRIISLGMLERYDCLRWVEYALNRWGEGLEILLAGFSMGAATVMMAAPAMPRQVKGMICDCGYSSPRAIIRDVSGKLHVLACLSYFFIRLSGRLLGRFDPEKGSSLSALRESRVPALFIHGEDDHYVPCSMAYENYAACAAEPKMLLTVPGAGHCLSFLTDENAYRKAVRDFLRQIGLS